MTFIYYYTKLGYQKPIRYLNALNNINLDKLSHPSTSFLIQSKYSSCIHLPTELLKFQSKFFNFTCC